MTRNMMTATTATVLLFMVLALIPWTGYAQPRTLVVLSQAGTLQKLMEEEVVPVFERESGVKVILIPGTAQANLTRVLAQRNRPEADVAIVNDIALVQGKQQGVWERLDPSIVTNLASVYDEARDPQGFGVAQGITATVIAYNTKVFDRLGWKPPTSWMDLLDPRYKGRVVPHHIINGFGVTYLFALNQVLGGKGADMTPLWSRLPALNENTLLWARTSSDFDNAFAQEAGWIGENGATRINILIDQGLPLRIVYPKEGGVFITAQLAAIRNAPNPRLAQQFINLVLSVPIQKRLSETQYYGPVNTRVQLSAETASRVPYGVRQVRSLKRPDWEIIAANYDQWISRFTSIIGR